MELKLNREYALRHLFVVVLMVGLCGWFGYDGFVRYPATPAHDLYVAIEKSEPQTGLDLEAFKAQKTKTQYGFTFLTLFVAAQLVAVTRWSGLLVAAGAGDGLRQLLATVVYWLPLVCQFFRKQK